MGKRIRHIQEQLPGLEEPEPAPLSYPDRFKLTPEEIALGKHWTSKLLAELEERRALRSAPPKPEGGPRVVLGSRANSRITSFTNGHSPSIESDDNGSK